MASAERRELSKTPENEHLKFLIYEFLKEYFVFLRTGPLPLRSVIVQSDDEALTIRVEMSRKHYSAILKWSEDRNDSDYAVIRHNDQIKLFHVKFFSKGIKVRFEDDEDFPEHSYDYAIPFVRSVNMREKHYLEFDINQAFAVLDSNSETD